MAEPVDEFVVEVTEADLKSESVPQVEHVNVVDEPMLEGEEEEEDEGETGPVVETINMATNIVTLQGEDGTAMHGVVPAGGEADLGPDDEIVIQIMTPDGQIVTTTAKQGELMQSLPLDQLEDAAGQQQTTFVVPTEADEEYQVSAVKV